MDQEKKKQLIIKACCVIFATVLRFYVSNVENPIVIYEIKNVPVNIVNEGKLKNSGLILIKKDQYTVDLTIKGATSQVKKLNRNNFKINADLESLALKKGENKILVTVEDYPDGVKIIANQQMLITIDLDAYIEREFKVNVTLNGSTKAGYYAHETKISPETIRVAGAERELNNINKVVAEVDLKGADNDINREVELKVTDSSGEELSGIEKYPNKIKVVVPINRTKSVPVRIVESGELDKDLSLKSIVQNIQIIKVSGDEADLKILDEIETEVLNLDEIQSSQTVKLGIKIPKGIKVIDGTEFVEAKIDVEKIIEKSIINILTVNNLEEGYEAKLQYSTINVTIRGVASLMNETDYRNVQCEADLQGLKEGTHIVPINIKTPDNIDVVSSDIESVKVDITEKEEVTIPEDEIPKEDKDKSGIDDESVVIDDTELTDLDNGEKEKEIEVKDEEDEEDEEEVNIKTEDVDFNPQKNKEKNNIR